MLPSYQTVMTVDCMLQQQHDCGIVAGMNNVILEWSVGRNWMFPQNATVITANANKKETC